MDQQDLSDVMQSLRLKALEIEESVKKVAGRTMRRTLPDCWPDIQTVHLLGLYGHCMDASILIFRVTFKEFSLKCPLVSG